MFDMPSRQELGRDNDMKAISREEGLVSRILCPQAKNRESEDRTTAARGNGEKKVMFLLRPC